MDPTPANLQVFFTGLNTQYRQAYTETETWYPQVATDMPSATELETYGWMDRIQAMRQWVGPRQENSVLTQPRIVVNLDWELTVALPRNKFLDDKLGIFTPVTEEMGRQVRKQPDYQLASTLESNPIGFDGVTFFSTAHPTDTSGFLTSSTQSNDLASLALNVSNYSTARAAMRNFQGRDGKPFNSLGTLLIVPPALEEAALVVTSAPMIAPQTFGNLTTNVGATTNVWANRQPPAVLVIPELTHAKIWYLFDVRRRIKPLIRQVRQAPNWQPLINPTDPNVFWQKQFIWGVDTREAYDVSLWWMALRCGSGL